MELKVLKVCAMIFGLCVPFAPTASLAFQENQPGEIERVSVEETAGKTQSGNAVLVCSYDDNRCKGMLFEGAILRSEFEERRSSLAKNQEILFYCD